MPLVKRMSRSGWPIVAQLLPLLPAIIRLAEPCYHSLKPIVRHNCYYKSGRIGLTPFRAASRVFRRRGVPRALRAPGGPQPGIARASSQGLPQDRALRGQSIAEEQSRSSNRQPAGAIACRSGYTSLPRKGVGARNEGGTDELRGQGPQTRHEQLQCSLSYFWQIRAPVCHARR